MCAHEHCSCEARGGDSTIRAHVCVIDNRSIAKVGRRRWEENVFPLTLIRAQRVMDPTVGELCSNDLPRLLLNSSHALVFPTPQSRLLCINVLYIPLTSIQESTPCCHVDLHIFRGRRSRCSLDFWIQERLES